MSSLEETITTTSRSVDLTKQEVVDATFKNLQILLKTKIDVKNAIYFLLHDVHIHYQTGGNLVINGIVIHTFANYLKKLNLGLLIVMQKIKSSICAHLMEYVEKEYGIDNFIHFSSTFIDFCPIFRRLFGIDVLSKPRNEIINEWKANKSENFRKNLAFILFSIIYALERFNKPPTREHIRKLLNLLIDLISQEQHKNVSLNTEAVANYWQHENNEELLKTALNNRGHEEEDNEEDQISETTVTATPAVLITSPEPFQSPPQSESRVVVRSDAPPPQPKQVSPPPKQPPPPQPKQALSTGSVTPFPPYAQQVRIKPPASQAQTRAAKCPAPPPARPKAAIRPSEQSRRGKKRVEASSSNSESAEGDEENEEGSNQSVHETNALDEEEQPIERRSSRVRNAVQGQQEQRHVVVDEPLAKRARVADERTEILYIGANAARFTREWHTRIREYADRVRQRGYTDEYASKIEMFDHVPEAFIQFVHLKIQDRDTRKTKDFHVIPPL